MKLSDGEKLILIMLSDIQEAQGVRNSVDPELVRSAIYYDCAWGIPMEYPGIPFSDTTTPKIVEDVSNILQMWTLIETSYAKLSEDDRIKVEAKAYPFGSAPHFEGFDSNSEAEELRIVSFLVDYLNRFINFKGRILISAMPLGGRYKRMYEIYEPMLTKIDRGRLSADQLIAILLQGSAS